MAQPIYRAGIVGLGMIGGGDSVSADALGQRVADMDGTHFAALWGNSRVQVVAGSSRDEGRRQRFEQRTGLKTYANWQEMLDREKLDIVSVATYAPAHAEITNGAAERGIKVIYCEKPIATRLVDAEAMVSSCASASSLLVINHNRRFNLNYRRLRDLIAQGGLGTLTSISLLWGTGRLGNVGTHFFDAVILLTGQRIKAVSGTLDLTGRPDCRGPKFHDPGGWGLLRLDSGAMVTVDAADEGKGPGWLVLNGTKGRATTGNGEVKLDFWDGRQEHWPLPAGGKTSMDQAVKEIVDWLDKRKEFCYPASEAANVLEAIMAFHVSHERKSAWVELPLNGADRTRVLQSG